MPDWHHRHDVMPRMSPFADVGRRGIRAYAARSGQTEEEFLKRLGESWTPEMAGSALVDLVRTDAATTAPEYLLTGAGLQKLPCNTGAGRIKSG